MFDTVAHKRFYSKLATNEICDPILGWIKDFLNGRTQRVVVNGTPLFGRLPPAVYHKVVFRATSFHSFHQ